MDSIDKETKMDSINKESKLKEISSPQRHLKRCNNDNFLEIGLPPNNENLKDNFEITSEVNLLKMEESFFERRIYRSRD
ncbi:unnamed protein product [Rhizophagus irregularis]|uniref:Uncharacterized protein n=1 Tax=Rhizophagus irregularis TaxID=588596 RepID=A0A916EF07_9GLOM|nr:unnamed protein product [Rhizophagus irregularis]CAB5382524.1 unnamed protein product [Rhizophagus irregularis]